MKRSSRISQALGSLQMTSMPPSPCLPHTSCSSCTAGLPCFPWDPCGRRFSKNICILILVDACASAIGFYFLGYAFAFGDDPESPNKFIGTKFFVMSGLPALDAAAMPQYYQWLFQWSFAATACTIVSGAIAERTRFPVYVVYSFFMAAWVYPIVVHSVWSPFGWASTGQVHGQFVGGHWGN
eukprot:jgi/Botrbrau1/11542/Bobra.0393s0020.1